MHFDFEAEVCLGIRTRSLAIEELCAEGETVTTGGVAIGEFAPVVMRDLGVMVFGRSGLKLIELRKVSESKGHIHINY